MASDLERGVGALKKFQGQVDSLLAELEGGDGGKGKIAAQSVSRGSFSGTNIGFSEADGFFVQYNRVHAALISLSKQLSDQIELMRIGVHAANVGYDNVDEGLRQRFHTIQARLEEQREAQEKALERERAGQSDKPEAPRQNATGGTKDMG
ncbi:MULTISPECIES: hypothetical protein [unclassified Streptomyces]|uniref:hypothetical protein n=1 Tax=unclassified Streptomyces TaxID=2593676 RepID=UPI0033216F88